MLYIAYSNQEVNMKISDLTREPPTELMDVRGGYSSGTITTPRLKAVTSSLSLTRASGATMTTDVGNPVDVAPAMIRKYMIVLGI